MSDPLQPTDPRQLRAVDAHDGDALAVEAALYEFRRVIAGQQAMLERTFVCLLAGGHLLFVGVPGLA